MDNRGAGLGHYSQDDGMIIGYLLALIGLGLFGIAVAKSRQSTALRDKNPNTSELATPQIHADPSTIFTREPKQYEGDTPRPILMDWTETLSLLRPVDFEHHFATLNSGPHGHTWNIPKASQYYLHVNLPTPSKASPFAAPRDEVALSTTENEVEKSMYKRKIRMIH